MEWMYPSGISYSDLRSRLAGIVMLLVLVDAVIVLLLGRVSQSCGSVGHEYRQVCSLVVGSATVLEVSKTRQLDFDDGQSRDWIDEARPHSVASQRAAFQSLRWNRSPD